MSKPHRKSIIRQALDRLDERMAIGESRRAAKQERRAADEHVWTFSTGRMHSHKTRQVYQEQVLRFVNWARDTCQVKTLEELDARANELASAYLQQEIGAGKSPYTLQTIRSALRLFFADPTLARAVTLPRRTRAAITRSRGPAARDRHVQPANWQPFFRFARACGLRRSELRRLRVEDILRDEQGRLVVQVQRGKGGKARRAPVLPGYEQEILAVVAGRPVDERVFARLPDTDIHALRREYAQALYLSSTGGAALPPPTGRLRRADYDLEAVRQVSRALGHNRLDIVLAHYLR